MLQYAYKDYKRIVTKEHEVVRYINFDSLRKRSTVAIRNEDDPDNIIIFSCGAPDEILKLCSKYQKSTDEVAELDEEQKTRIKQFQTEFNQVSLKMLMMSMKVVKYDDFK